MTRNHLTARLKGESVWPDRREAGRRLGECLLERGEGREAMVLGIPRGGVPVAYEAARALRAPLDVFMVRKLGLPGREELAMGAIASGGVRILNRSVIEATGVGGESIEAVTRRERAELDRRELCYRGGRPAPDVAGRAVVLVDDGLATGSTMRAAVDALRRLDAERITVAVPVGAPDTCAGFEDDADAVVCLQRPEPFLAVGHWYADFSATEDDEVVDLLSQARHRPRSGG